MVRSITLTLTILCLHFTVYGQGNTSQEREKPPTQSPSPGTGRTEIGPTSIFTIYDGGTIRRGEFTLSIANSSFDRDPGDIEVWEIPFTFNVGINDHLELFFKANGYRAVKVGKPHNLPGFLPLDSPLYFPTTTGCVLACNTRRLRRFSLADAAGSSLSGNPLFVPSFTTEIDSSFSGSVGVGKSDTFIAFDYFNVLSGYLPDAPFANRLIAANMVRGTNVWLVGLNDLVRLEGGLVYYLHRPINDISDVSEMQSGTGTVEVGDSGWVVFSDSRLSRRVNVSANAAYILSDDSGLGNFIDGRLGRHVNLSANAGYILNDMPHNDVIRPAVMADNRYEMLVGVGFDFPVNKDFKLTTEALSTVYIGNQPLNTSVEALGVDTIIGRRWGFETVHSRSLTRPDQSQLEGELKGKEPAHDSLAGANPSSYKTNPFSNLIQGKFVFDPSVSEEIRKLVREALKRGPEDLRRICRYYGFFSRECRDFKKAIESFGPEGVDNGVVLTVGQVRTKGAAAETTVGPCSKHTTENNPTGGTITITLTEKAAVTGDLIHTLRHEGSHTADGLRWQASGCHRILNNPLQYETEFKAFSVGSLSAQAYKPNAPYRFFIPGGVVPGKNPYVPLIVPIYRPNLNREELEALRTDNIPIILAQPKDRGGIYEVTPKHPGGRVFGTGGYRQ